MKRFWTEAGAVRTEGGWQVQLDGRPLRTPARAPLLLPTIMLADAIAAEWQAAQGKVAPGSLPLTGLANAATDIVTADHGDFAESLAGYAESELLCYRADAPLELVAHQAAHWEPLLKAVEARHALLFRRTAGVMHVPQPPETLARVQTLYAGFNAWQLAALQPVVTITGSAVIALALIAGDISAEAAFDAGALEELWQAAHWGEDSLATAARAERRRTYDAAIAFLSLIAAPPLE